MRRTVYVVLAVIALPPLLSFASAFPDYVRLVRDELNAETLKQPPDLNQLLPGDTSSARLARVKEICQRQAPGAVGMRLETFRVLPLLERAAGNELSYMGFEQIVRETGSPVRFEDEAPLPVKYVIEFLVSPPEGAKLVESFEDMGLFALGK